MPYAGEKPGAGSYECNECNEIMILTDTVDELPPCPYCKAIKYISITSFEGGVQTNTYQYDLFKNEPVEDTVKRFFSGYFS